jgi:hypothetical protein
MQRDLSKVNFKKYNNTNLGIKRPEVKVVAEEENQDSADNLRLLTLCGQYYNALDDFRRRRERARKFYSGDQWSDKVEDPDNPGEYITEMELIVRQGKTPLKNNQIRNLVRNLLGQYRSNKTKPIVVARDRDDASASEMMTNALQAVHQINEIPELDVRAYEEFLISGGAVGKINYRYWRSRKIEDVYYENVNMNRVFFNTNVEDPRLTDLNLMGCVLDIDMDDLVSAFARSKDEEKKIRGWYGHVDSVSVVHSRGLDSNRLDGLSFLSDLDPQKCRVIEAWELRGEWRVYSHDWLDASYEVHSGTKKELAKLKADIALMNRQRVAKVVEAGMPEDEAPLIEFDNRFDRFWYVKYLTPYGQCLYEGETPFSHKEHPYVMALYPMVDGKVWGFVEDIIDQQKYINRMIIMIDFIMGASAKGVLLLPEDAIPDDMTEEDFAEEWTRYNGVIKYKAKPGVEIPRQISTNSTNIGVHEMLSLQMRMLQEISGVNGAIQGHTAGSGKAASLYAQEAQNATISTMDVMDSFKSFKERRDRKILKVIQQFYDEERNLIVSGKSYSAEAKKYDPKAVQNIEFEYSLGQSTDTPAFRQLLDESLMKLLDGQYIDIQMYLENSSIPFADKLLEQIKQRQQAVAGGELPQQFDPETMQQIQGQADPRVIEMFNNALGKVS